MVIEDSKGFSEFLQPNDGLVWESQTQIVHWPNGYLKLKAGLTSFLAIKIVNTAYF